jgi:hypothetical protein
MPSGRSPRRAAPAGQYPASFQCLAYGHVLIGFWSDFSRQQSWLLAAKQFTLSLFVFFSTNGGAGSSGAQRNAAAAATQQVFAPTKRSQTRLKVLLMHGHGGGPPVMCALARARIMYGRPPVNHLIHPSIRACFVLRHTVRI